MGETAVIDFEDKAISDVILHIGREIASMTDQEVFNVDNDVIRVQ
jgi:hypothetical protein